MVYVDATTVVLRGGNINTPVGIGWSGMFLLMR
jgi:hypothetical protein